MCVGSEFGGSIWLNGDSTPGNFYWVFFSGVVYFSSIMFLSGTSLWVLAMGTGRRYWHLPTVFRLKSGGDRSRKFLPKSNQFAGETSNSGVYRYLVEGSSGVPGEQKGRLIFGGRRRITQLAKLSLKPLNRSD